MTRTTRDLCQDCWQDANPTEYAPVATRFGPCAECGAEALVVRSRRADEAPDTEDAPAVVNPDGSPTAATLAYFGRDAAADCACCGMDFYRTADGGCTYCVTRPDGSRPICCRN